jgi:hypothetical protein
MRVAAVMTYGVRCRKPGTGEILFDSSAESTLLYIEERVIAGSALGSGLTYDYPAFAGFKLCAFMVSPYQNGDIDGHQVMSCRVSYVSGVPRVTVFVDRTGSGIPVNDGLLMVFSTGAPQ